MLTGEIMWPDNDDELVFVPDDAKNLIKSLLKHDALDRLGAGGTAEIKEHAFFHQLDWDNLLRIKADFIPQLDGPDDTSYFDTRSERYNHNTNSNDSKTESTNGLVLKTSRSKSNDDDLDDDTDNELFASFSSCSSKFKHHSSTSNITVAPYSNNAFIETVPSTLVKVAETKSNEETCVFVKPSTPPPKQAKQNESDQKLFDLGKLSLNDDIEPSPSQNLAETDAELLVIKTNAKPIEKVTLSENKDTKTTKHTRMPLRQTRSNLSSSSFCVKKTENTLKFPNSQSHSKLSLLTVPCDDLNKQQHHHQQYQSRLSFKSTNNNKSQVIEPKPIRDLLILAKSKPAVCIKRGPRGFGFTLQAVRVYYGDSNVYTIQHLVVQVDENGPAHEGGLEPQDLITHVNDKVVCGMLHHEIIKCIMSNTSNLRLHTVPMNKTSIKTGGRKRSPSKSKLSRPAGCNNSYTNSVASNSIQSRVSQSSVGLLRKNSNMGSNSQLDCVPHERKKKTTLFRKLSERRAQRYEYMQQQSPVDTSPLPIQQDNNQNQQPKWNGSINDLTASTFVSNNQQYQPTNQVSFDSSSSSSPISSVPSSPAMHHNARPRSLIMFNTNNAILLGHVPQPQGLHPSPSSTLLSSTSHSPQLNLQTQFQYHQVQQHRMHFPFLHCNPIVLAQNQFFNTNMPMSPSSLSSVASCTPLNSQNQSQPAMMHLNPSPLAISDGLPLTYGNPNSTQTFTPATIQHNQFVFQQQHQRPKLIMSNMPSATTPNDWHNQMSPNLNLVPLTPIQHASLQKSQTYFNYPVTYNNPQHQQQQPMDMILDILGQHQQIQHPD
jgi:microtubule-associated serine/threonine kinase